MNSRFLPPFPLTYLLPFFQRGRARNSKCQTTRVFVCITLELHARTLWQGPRLQNWLEASANAGGAGRASLGPIRAEHRYISMFEWSGDPRTLRNTHWHIIAAWRVLAVHLWCHSKHMPMTNDPLFPVGVRSFFFYQILQILQKHINTQKWMEIRENVEMQPPNENTCC